MPYKENPNHRIQSILPSCLVFDLEAQHELLAPEDRKAQRVDCAVSEPGCLSFHSPASLSAVGASNRASGPGPGDEAKSGHETPEDHTTTLSGAFRSLSRKLKREIYIYVYNYIYI